MNILELDSFNLADTVKFHDRLNPRLWDSSEHLRPEVHAKLVEIARDFQEFLGVPDLDVKDITVSGSNAAYNYTPTSDIDLHLVVDLPQADNNEVYRELFDAKKFQYNNIHNIKIGGYDVELYVQNPNEEHHSQGIYSLLRNDWVSVPKRRKAEIDDISTKSKYEDLAARIDDTVNSGNHDSMAALMKKIKAVRQNGLDKYGELGADNLAFKLLRNNGYIKKLVDARNAARDLELSLDEAKKKKKKKVKYGFGTYWYPGYAFGDSGEGGGDGGGGESRMMESPDGVNPSTKMFLEEPSSEDESIVRDFIDFVADRLGIAQMPEIVLHTDPTWSRDNKSFGRYTPETHTLEVNLANRHIMDTLRTTAHELVHCRQNQERQLPGEAGETGSRWENQAHAIAGVIMRDYADQNPAMFESSGYIPTDAEKNDPRFKMALTKDVRPGQTGKEANKMALKTDAQGRPGLLMKPTNLRESRMPQPSQGQGKYRDLNDPLGPESPPKMPDGTLKIDVSDTQDWYQLGQDISNLKLANKDHYNQGPPHTVISFGSEDLEHMYSRELKRLGLPTHDLDEPGEEDEDLDEELTEAQLMEIKMTGKNLRAEAAKTGAQAGMEFEMIVPNVETDIEPEYEPDYDQDQRARSFSDVRDFFHDGDYNGRRQVDNLIEELSNEYEDWMQEQTAEQWDRDGVDYIRDFIEVNDLFDRDEALDQARDEVIAANPDLPPESEDFQQLVNARIDELQEQFVLEAYEDQGRIYNDAFETFAEEQRDEYDERSFLDDRYQTMTDIQSNFDISWPYYYDINDGQNGDMDGQQVADEFSSYMGKPVNYSSQYHGGRREPGTYVVEPDGSLNGDNPGDGGLEFVSPPMPIDEMISDLNKVKAWAGETGCYTNDSTGLHINISVPNYSIDKLDYVKLAILMGDEYILDLFGRSGNTYAKSAMGKIKSVLKQKPEAAAQIMDLMKQGLDGAATKAIHTGITDKYTSINTKTGYIEFRSPGGDWLDSNFDKIENTLLRFTVALSAAINPEAYRKEYLTKLYKLLSEGMADKSDVNIIQLFSNYSAGELDKPALIRQVRAKQLARNVAKGKATGKMWWKVSNPANSFASIEVVAGSKEEAIDIAVQPGNYPDWARAKNTLRATPIRPYQEEPKGPTLNGRPSNPDGNYVIVDSADEQTPVYRYMASGGNDSLLVLRQWIAANPGRQWNFKFDPTQLMGQPTAQSQQPAAENQGNWGFWLDGAERFVRIPRTEPGGDGQALRRFETEDAASAWLNNHRARNPGVRADISVREIPADYQWPPADAATTTPAVNRNTLMPTGPGPWEVFRISDGSSVAELGQTNRMSAEVEARRVIDQRREAPELYGVRTVPTNNTDNWSADFERRMQTGTADAAQGGTVDVAGEQPAQAPQTLTRPGQGQQQFTGTWLVLDPEDREIYRFSGVGNNQSDANRVAMNWMRQNPGRMQAGVTVVPEMQ
jgi:hypothetical protein